MTLDPYAELGVDRGSSEAEIKKAYRRKAKALHPDQHPGDKVKAEAFKRASKAYDILGDKEKRGKFDRGEIDGEGNPRGFHASGGGGFPGGFGPQPNAQGDAFEDILRGMFGGGRRRNPGPQRGRDVRYRIEIDFADAAAGARRRMTMSDGRKLDVNIPPGVETGQTLRLKSQGGPPPGGKGPPGDAMLELVVAPSKIWERDGANLRMSVQVPLKIAVLGGAIDVRTPSGPVTLKIPEGANTGQTLRLKGKGIQLPNQPGHLYARLEVVIEDPGDPDLRKWAKDHP